MPERIAADGESTNDATGTSTSSSSFVITDDDDDDDFDSIAVDSHRSASSSFMQIRVGTWNVLSLDDEYNDEYVCPLSIALCGDSVGGNGTTYTTNTSTTNTSTTTGTTSTPMEQRRLECTRARYRRVWQRLEQLATSLDVLALQEGVDEFTRLQSVDTHWFRIDTGRTTTAAAGNDTDDTGGGECSLWLSQHSNLTVAHTFTVNLSSLSGCPAMPMAILTHATVTEPTKPGTTTPTAAPAATSALFIVGSVHVQASVTNMTDWFHVSAGLIHKATALALLDDDDFNRTGNNTSNSLHDGRKPSWIVAGDFNHNLTDYHDDSTLLKNKNTTATTTANDTEWQFVYDTTNATADLCHGTSQKEHNWMGVFDGFWVSSPTRHESVGNDTWLTQVIRVQALVDGFMPKVVSNLPQGTDATPPLQAQFAVVSAIAGDGIPVSRQRIEQWTALDDDDLHLVFSPSSNHTASSDSSSSTDTPPYPVPHSNPRTQALSDHLMVTATFELVPTLHRQNGTKQIPPPSPMVQSSSSRSASRRMVLFWSSGVVVAALLLLAISFVAQMRRHKQTRHPRYGEIRNDVE